MRNLWITMILLLFTSFTLMACTGNDTNNEGTGNNPSDQPLKVVTTFTLLEDMVNEIAGDRVEIHNLVPIGTDPHEYDALPDDTKAVIEADLLFYNGLNLEGGDNGWFARMIESTNQDWDITFKAAEGVEPMYLSAEGSRDEEVNPHSFLDPVVGIQMAENIEKALIEIDPENKEVYEENAEEYLTALEEVAQTYEEKINEIPEEDRILITSERAYQYLADRYGLTEGYIWAIDTEENVSQEQITSLIEFIKEHNPPSLFVETNVDQRPMKTVAEESGVDIFGEIFSDEIGNPGEEGDTYIKYLMYNIEIIHEGLLQEK